MVLYWQVDRLVALFVVGPSHQQRAETYLPREVAEEIGRYQSATEPA